MSTEKKRLHTFTSSQKEYVARGIHEYPLPVRIFFNVAYALVYLYAEIRWHGRIEGEDDFVAYARTHGVVMVMNHTSMIEPTVLATRLWRRGILTRPIYKVEFDKYAAGRMLFSRLGGIPITRDSADLGAVRAAKDALKRGECVLVYPEGTRIKDDDQPIEIHGGFALIAQMAHAAVVPMAVVGARDPYHTRPTRAKRPVISIDEPITFADLAATSRKAQIEEMEQRAMKRVYELRDELRITHPGLW